MPDRDSFNIGEAARIAQVPEHTLRYWESRLGFLRPARRESGHRRYTRRDLEMVLKIKDLVQTRRMTLDGAKRWLNGERRGFHKSEAPGGEANRALERVLREVRSELRDILLELSK